MNEKEDIYIIKRTNNGIGACFFYKNGLLHREVGPAVVTLANRDEFLNLGDESLYKETPIDSKFPNGYKPENIFVEDNIKGKNVLVYSIAIYYLNGQAYSYKEFEEAKIKLDLKKELDKELDTSQSNIKRSKV
jgi:hypothetical protein